MTIMKKKLLIQETIAEEIEVQWSVEPHLSLHIAIDYPNLNESFGKLYWRLDDPAGENLINFDINRYSGLIEMIELIIYNGTLGINNENDKTNSIPTRIGAVKIDTNIWTKEYKDVHPMAEMLPFPRDEKFVDFPGKPQIQVGSEELRIELFNEPICSQVLMSEDLALELNSSDEVCAVNLMGFTGKYRKLFVEGYKKRLGK